MRVLPVDCTNYQSKTKNNRPMTEHSFQKKLLNVPERPELKSSDAINIATAIGVLSSGAALAFSAPIAMVVGAIALLASIPIIAGADAIKSLAQMTKPAIRNLLKKV